MHVFYINLDREVRRRAHIESQLGSLGLAAERLPAVTPADLTDPVHSASTGAVRISPPELACLHSHRRLWQEIVARGLRAALIVEDDVLLSPRLPHLLLMLDQAPLDLDVVRIETQEEDVRLGRPTFEANGIGLRTIHSVVWGCGGYVVTREGAQRLLGPLARFDLPVDHIIFNYHEGTSRQLRIRQAFPAGIANGYAIAHQYHSDEFPSTLEPERSRRGERRADLQHRTTIMIGGWGSIVSSWRDGARAWFNRRFRGIETTTIPLL